MLHGDVKKHWKWAQAELLIIFIAAYLSYPDDDPEHSEDLVNDITLRRTLNFNLKHLISYEEGSRKYVYFHLHLCTSFYTIILYKIYFIFFILYNLNTNLVSTVYLDKAWKDWNTDLNCFASGTRSYLGSPGVLQAMQSNETRVYSLGRHHMTFGTFGPLPMTVTKYYYTTWLLQSSFQSAWTGAACYESHYLNNHFVISAVTLSCALHCWFPLIVRMWHILKINFYTINYV